MKFTRLPGPSEKYVTCNVRCTSNHVPLCVPSHRICGQSSVPIDRGCCRTFAFGDARQCKIFSQANAVPSPGVLRFIMRCTNETIRKRDNPVRTFPNWREGIEGSNVSK